MAVHGPEPLYIIDAIGPYFYKHPDKLINWSKISFSSLEKANGKVRKKLLRNIAGDFKQFLKKVSKQGYNALSIDDLCHLALLEIYPKKLTKKIKAYRKHFRKVFKAIKKRDMKILVTTDVMFEIPAITRYTRGQEKWIFAVMRMALENLFESFPEVDGVIFRIGECDGVDVEHEFKSSILLKTPAQVNRFIKAMLPVFEPAGKQMVFRTWTAGAWATGDLMWNENTYDLAFSGIDSESLIISMKYGEGDFFRGFTLSGFFLKNDGRRKLLELQTRREYEGFGTYPSFTGWEYYRFYRKVRGREDFAGIMVWCQTGGWSRFFNLTFLRNASFWAELNTYTTIRIFRYGDSVEKAAARFRGKKEHSAFIRFLELSDKVIDNLLYDPALSARKLYFNRLRIPPLLYVFWDSVTVNSMIIAFHNHFAVDPQDSLHAAQISFRYLKKMRQIAAALELPYDADFHMSTFELFLMCRKLMYGDNKMETYKLMTGKVEKYHRNYPKAYQFKLIPPRHCNSGLLKILFNITVRSRREYRAIDFIIFNRFTAGIYLLLFKCFRKYFPEFVNSRGMSLDKFLH